jgi:hypothetical protein
VSRRVPGSTMVTTARLRTAFRRGNGFRFEFDPVLGDGEARFSLFAVGDKAVELSPTGRRSAAPFPQALGRLVGLSSGTSTLLPSLLFHWPADSGPAFQVVCAHDAKHVVRLFIRKRDLALLRIEQRILTTRDPEEEAVGTAGAGQPPERRATALVEPVELTQLVVLHPDLDDDVSDDELAVPSEGDVQLR